MSKTKIYEKLLAIQQHVKGLAKDKKSHNFDYVTGNKLLSFIRPKMDELGLLLKTEVMNVHNERMDYATKYAEKSEILTTAFMKFTWVDVETGEKDENMFVANGMNGWDKGVGSAITYGERYFLMKYFHIPTDEDDIDNPEVAPKEDAAPKKAVEKAVEVAKDAGYVQVDEDGLQMQDEHEAAREAYKQLYGKYPSSKMTTESIWKKVDEKNKMQAALNTVEALTSKDTFVADGERILKACAKSNMSDEEIGKVKVALNNKFKSL
jgi:hypothetical protein